AASCPNFGRKAQAIGHARRGRAVHGHALSSIQRTRRLCSYAAHGPARLRPAIAGASSSPPTHSRRHGPTHRRRWQGGHLSVGVTKTHAITGLLAEDSDTRTITFGAVVLRMAK